MDTVSVVVEFAKVHGTVSYARKQLYAEAVSALLAKGGLTGTFRLRIGVWLPGVKRPRMFSISHQPGEGQEYLSIGISLGEAEGSSLADLYPPRDLRPVDACRILAGVLDAKVPVFPSCESNVERDAEIAKEKNKIIELPKANNPVQYTEQLFARLLPLPVFAMGALSCACCSSDGPDFEVFTKTTRVGLSRDEFGHTVREALDHFILFTPELFETLNKLVQRNQKKYKPMSQFLRQVLPDSFCIGEFLKVSWIEKVDERYFFLSRVIPKDTGEEKSKGEALSQYLELCLRSARAASEDRGARSKITLIDRQMHDLKIKIDALQLEMSRLEADRAKLAPLCRALDETVTTSIDKLSHDAFNDSYTLADLNDL